ncbi:MAG: asparagine synthase (glutamine-hydrolyzing), partial [Zetaproteobacteria bacterium]
HQGRRWLFASTLDALARAEGVRLTLRAEALEQLIRTMRIPAPATIYREAWALPAGTMLVIDEESQAKAFRWADDFPKEVNSLMSFDEAVHEAMRALDASVRRRLIGDRPLGVFLSGGVDSSLIAESAMRAAGHVRTFSVRFAGAEGGFDESAYAAEVARAIGAEHEVLDVRPQALEALEELAEALDQPLGNSTALPMLLLARTARAHTVVALHGVGGDELFAGYPRHFGFVWHAMLHRAIGWPVWGKLAARMADAADARNLRGRIRRWLAALSDPPARAYRRWLAAWDEADVPIVELEAQPSAPPVPLPDPLAEGGGLEAWLERLDPLHAAMLYDVREYLAHDLLVLADRTTMHWGLELRAPFLCPRLYQLAFAAHFRLHLSPWHPERGLKRLLKAVAQRRLPKSVWARPKQGFMLPIRQWFAGELAGKVAGLAAPKAKLAGLVRLDFRRRVVGEHQSGRDRSDVLWTLLLLEAWLVRRGLV